MEAHSDIARSLDEVEREYSAIIEHLGLDTRQHRVREFIRRMKNFSPFIQEELEKVSRLEKKKRELEDQMDKMAAEAIKIRLTGSFQQSDMAKRAGEVRDVNKRIQGVNQRIFEITSKIQEEAGEMSDNLDDAVHLSHYGRAVGGTSQSVHSGPTSHSVRSGPSVEKRPGQRKRRRTGSRSPEPTAEEIRRRHAIPAPPPHRGASASRKVAEPHDPSEPVYCICRQVSFGDMIACDNPRCEYEWFHFKCVNITRKPEGTWYCPMCKDSMSKERNLFEPYTSKCDTTAADLVLTP